MANSAFSFKKPEDSPGFLLWQATTKWQRLIKSQLEPYAISHAQFVILAVLLWFEENRLQPNQVDIINKTLLDKMTVSKSLKKLVAQGLIGRHTHSQDTRAKAVYLTSEGRKLTGKLIPLVEQVDQHYFAGLNKSEQNSLKKIFTKLIIAS